MPLFSSTTQTDETAIFVSSGGKGLHGESTSNDVAAIAGYQKNISPVSTSPGVYGESHGGGAGVHGQSYGCGAGIVGINSVKSDSGGEGGIGGFFTSEKKDGVHAKTKSRTGHAIAGYQDNPSAGDTINGNGAAIYGEHAAGGLAAFFKGNVIVTGDISFSGADFAEDFTIKTEVFAEPGTVMALSGTGELVPCVAPYEKKVVGVVAGAGSHRTGIIMDKQEESAVRRQPIALVGKVFCKVDASYGAIEVGDLLTSSATHGHAMKASDPARSFGAVIGKAMAPLSDGLGLIPILISLQ